MIDLDDTSGCPLQPTCVGCNGATELRLETVQTPVGVFCLTLCPECRPADQVASWSFPVVWAVERSLEHCEHLGITADEMAQAMS